MKKTIYALLAATTIITTLFGTWQISGAQTNRATTITTTTTSTQADKATPTKPPVVAAPTARSTPAPLTIPGNLLTALPTSDIVASINVQRLLTEALPQTLAGDAPRLQRVMSEIDDFQKRTGIDARSLNQIAVGIRFTDVPGRLPRGSTVALASGKFDANTITGMKRLASNGGVQEQTHSGRTVYVFSLNNQIKLPALPVIRITELAVTMLDAGTLAMGSPESVRAAIDTLSTNQNRVNPQIVQMAERTPNALIGVGGNVPASAISGYDIGNEEITSAVAAIRQFHFSVGSTRTGFEVQFIAATTGEAQAKKLNDTMKAMLQLVPILISQVPADLSTLVRNVTSSLTVTPIGNEVRLRTELKQPDIAALLRRISPAPTATSPTGTN